MQASELLNLSGKAAIVTGAASGIGLASAQLMADMGVSVALLDVNETKGQIEADKINQNGGKAIFLKCDVTSAAACESVSKVVFDSFGRIDILFNNAGVIKRCTACHSMTILTRKHETIHIFCTIYKHL